MRESAVADIPAVDVIEPAGMVQTMIATGASKADLGWADIFVRGMLGGALLGFGTSIAFGAISQGVPSILAGLLFPTGFIIINLIRADLITGYFALVPAALHVGRMTFGGLVRAWILVWAGNLAGGVIYAAIMWAGYTVVGELPAVAPPVVAAVPATAGATAAAPLPAPTLSPAQALLAPDPTGVGVATVVKRIALFKTKHYEQFGIAGFWAILLKGMLCNWMVTLGVILPYTSRSVIGKAVATFVPIYMFFALGYEHMVVNMFIIPAAMMFGAPITQGDFWIGNELPATIGNFLGGYLFTGLALGWTYRARAT
jgi:formate/nitrite transporter